MPLILLAFFISVAARLLPFMQTPQNLRAWAKDGIVAASIEILPLLFVAFFCSVARHRAGAGRPLANRRIQSAESFLLYGLCFIIILFSFVDLFHFYELGTRVTYAALSNWNAAAMRATVFTRYGVFLAVTLISPLILVSVIVWLWPRDHSNDTKLARIIAFPLTAATALVLHLAVAGTEQTDHAQRYVSGSAWRSVRTIFDYATGRSAPPVPNPRGLTPFTAEELGWLSRFCIFQPHLKPKGTLFNRVMLITVESLDAAFLHYYAPSSIPKTATPMLDDLHRLGTHFDNFWTTGTPTLFGLYSILLSRPLIELSVGDDPRTDSLFSWLRRFGIEGVFLRGTTRHYGDDGDRYPKWFKMERFFTIDDFTDRGLPTWDWGLTDRALLSLSRDILQQPGEPARLVVVELMDTHVPYHFDIPDEKLPHEIPKEDLRMRAIHSVDTLVGELLRDLRTNARKEDRTLVIITADHNEPGGDRSPPDKIPLLFVSDPPGLLPEADARRFASQVDLAPTVCSFMGVPPSPQFWGHDLFDPSCEGIALSSHEEILSLRSAGEEEVRVPFTYEHTQTSLKHSSVKASALSKLLEQRRNAEPARQAP